jgi:DNA-binding GntR family transcriptional regulator
MGLNSKPKQNKRIAEPIKSNEHIERIRTNLRDNPRDLLLFDLAVQTGIGMKNLLQLKVRHLIGVEVGGRIGIKPSTNNRYSIIMTDIVHNTFHKYLEKIQLNPDNYLFKSKKGERPLNLSSVSNMITGWFEAANIKNCRGAISLRKTWENHHKDKILFDKDTVEAKLKDLLDPIQTPTAQKLIFDKLLNAIISGKISPGTRLTTDEISKSSGVSHAPVRVALNWLEAKGFIESQKKRGSIVKELSIEELHEIIQIRIILETAAAKFSYKVCTEETLNLLESIIQRHKRAHNFVETDQLNRLFHQTLYRDANMPLLITLITDLYDRFSPYAALAWRRIGYIPDHNGKQPPEYYHIKILESLRRKNLVEIIKYLKMKVSRSVLLTEEVLKERKGRLSVE